MTPVVRCYLFTLACLLPAVAGTAHAQPRTYAFDPVHTRILVGVDHAGFSKALGTVSGATGTLVFDPGDWSSARVEVEVPLANLDFGDEEWNRATLASNLLDAARHPVARFASTRIEPVDDTRAIVHGTLRLHGVEREVALAVALNAAKRHPLPPFRRTVGFSASALLSRADFGIDAWKSVIGDVVELRIEAEATCSRHEQEPAEPTEPTAQDDATSPVDAPADTSGEDPPPATHTPPVPEPVP